MTGIFSGQPLFLLQGPQIGDFAWEGDDTQAIVVLVGIGVLIVIGILVRLMRGSSGAASARRGLGRAQASPRKFRAFTLFRIASAYGLSREQAKLLEYVFRNDGVSDPERVMNNLPLLDRHFKRAYRTIGKNSASDEEAQLRLTKLFSLRNVIEVAAGTGDFGPPKLSENTPATLVIGKDTYQVKVLSSRGQTVIIESPRSALGNPVRVGKGANVVLSFFTKSSEGFSLEGQVVSPSLVTDRGTGIQINHSGKLKPLIKRMYRRKEVSTRCDLFLVNLQEPERKKQPPKLIVGTKKFTGTVLDISAGGCAIKSAAPIQAGSRLKISMEYDDSNSIHILGQVIRINRSGAVGAILHVKFLKVPRRAFNSISATVYGYDSV